MQWAFQVRCGMLEAFHGMVHNPRTCRAACRPHMELRHHQAKNFETQLKAPSRGALSREGPASRTPLPSERESFRPWTFVSSLRCPVCFASASGKQHFKDSRAEEASDSATNKSSQKTRKPFSPEAALSLSVLRRTCEAETLKREG